MRFTLHEAVRRRLILAGILISVGYIGLFALGFNFAHNRAMESNTTAQGRLAMGVAFAVLTLFGVYVVNYLASFLALFLSVGAISGEVDSGTLHALLARPLRRSEFVLGRWIGYAILICGYTIAMVAMVLLVARAIAGYQVPDPLSALLLILLECLLLLTLSLLGSTVMPTLANGVVVFTLLGLAWLAGIIEVVGRLLASATEEAGADAMLTIATIVNLIIPSDALWRGASYYLQPPSLLAIGSGPGGGIPFFSVLPIATPMLVWAVGYTVVVLCAAIFSFSRRDL